jgi:hypothetical protein
MTVKDTAILVTPPRKKLHLTWRKYPGKHIVDQVYKIETLLDKLFYERHETQLLLNNLNSHSNQSAKNSTNSPVLTYTSIRYMDGIKTAAGNLAPNVMMVKMIFVANAHNNKRDTCW